MALTIMTERTTRLGSVCVVEGSIAAVAIDATVSERFQLPAGFGNLLIYNVVGWITVLSAAYVAPAPAYDGISLQVLSPDASTIQDIIGTSRFTHAWTSNTRPALMAQFDLNTGALLRQNEGLWLLAPILAGAGATATITVTARGVRTQSA